MTGLLGSDVAVDCEDDLPTAFSNVNGDSLNDGLGRLQPTHMGSLQIKN